jgi:hypothetical protein
MEAETQMQIAENLGFYKGNKRRPFSNRAPKSAES